MNKIKNKKNEMKRSYEYLWCYSKFIHVIFLGSYKIPQRYSNVMHLSFIRACKGRLYSSLMLFFKILVSDHRKRYSVSRSLILIIKRFCNGTRWNFVRSLKIDLNGAKYTTNSLHDQRYSRRAIMNT